MRALIEEKDSSLREPPDRRSVQIGRIREERDLITRKRKLPKKVEPILPPKTTHDDLLADEESSVMITYEVSENEMVDEEAIFKSVETGVRARDNEPIPFLRIDPIYPRRARSNYIEGWVVVAFDINPNGDTVNVRVLRQRPKNFFSRAALNAVSKWRYEPKVIEGVPVYSRGHKVRIDFDLN